MKNLLIASLVLITLGGCASGRSAESAGSQFNPTDLPHFSYLSRMDAEDSISEEPFAEEEIETQEVVQQSNSSFFTWNENRESSELN